MFCLHVYFIRLSLENQGSVSNYKSFAHIRSLQLLNYQYNTVFKLLNAFNFFNMWFNLVFYAVSTANGMTAPFPEYFILPTLFLVGALFMYMMFLQMSIVRTSWDEYQAATQQMNVSKIMEKFLISVRPLGVQLANFGIVDHLAPLTFLNVTIDYVISLTLATA